MRIKTLTELKQHFEVLPANDEKGVLGGMSVSTQYGTMELNDAYLTQGFNFVSDNDPATFGGGSFNYFDGNGNLQSRSYAGSSGSGYDSITFIGTFAGFDGGINKVYYDDLVGGYLFFYSTESNNVIAYQEEVEWGQHIHDFNISYKAIGYHYFDELVGGYTNTPFVTEVTAVYTGYDTWTEERRAQEIAAAVAAAKARAEEDLRRAERYAAGIFDRMDAAGSQLFQQQFQSQLNQFANDNRKQAMQDSLNAQNWWNLYIQSWEYHNGDFNAWSSFWNTLG